MAGLARDSLRWDTIQLVQQRLRLAGQSELEQQIANDYQQLRNRLDEAFERLQAATRNDHLDQPLGDSDLSVGWVLNNVPHLTNVHVSTQVDCKLLSTDGFVSQIIRVVVGDEQTASTSVIVKLPETRSIRNALLKTLGHERIEEFMPLRENEERIRAMYPQFNREIDFYLMNDIVGLKIPQVYYTKPWDVHNTGVIVMEDLSYFKAKSFFISLNSQEFNSICDQLLVLHTYSHKMSSQWNELAFPKPYYDLLQSLQPVVDDFVEFHPELSNLYRQLKHLYAKTDFLDYCLHEAHLDLGLPDVVCHGDMWTYNFLWDSQNVSRLGAIIDWQNVHTGSIGEDFGHLLAMCFDGDVRRNIEATLLPQYAEQLAENIFRVHGEESDITAEKFLKAYRISFMVHALHLPFISNIMLNYKSAVSDEVVGKRTQILVERVKSAWEDAIEILNEELPNWAISYDQLD